MEPSAHVKQLTSILRRSWSNCSTLPANLPTKSCSNCFQHRSIERSSLLGFDRSNFYLRHKRQIVAQIGVAGVAGFDGGDFAVVEQPEKIAEPPAGERHIT